MIAESMTVKAVAILHLILIFILLVSPYSGQAQIDCGLALQVSGQGHSHSPIQQASWAQLEASVNALLLSALHDKTLYPPNSAHVRTLKSVFNIYNLPNDISVLAHILSTYNTYMNQLILENQIQKDQVLRPAFVLRTRDGKIIWRQFGEAIPEGAQFYSGEIPESDFDAMVLSGFFPIGDSSTTSGGARKSTFEHDLGHFTGFVESPTYMAQLSQVIKDIFKQRQFVVGYGADSNVLSTPIRERVYFYSESLTVVNQQTKSRMLDGLVLSNSMRSRLEDVNYVEMKLYLEKLPPQELTAKFMPLLEIVDQLFIPLGGAARNSGERDSTFHNRFYGLLSRGIHEKRADYLAAFQIAAIHLRDVTAKDWFDQVFNPYVPKDSRLYRYFLAQKDYDFSSDPFYPEGSTSDEESTSDVD